jgi:hypothetical protein
MTNRHATIMISFCIKKNRSQHLWLAWMWRGPSESCQDMIDIIFMLLSSLAYDLTLDVGDSYTFGFGSVLIIFYD